jgi:superoxide dismutase, Fe-Mn family
MALSLFSRAGRAIPACTRSIVTQTLPDLPYDYGELEPVVSAKIMKLHHDKHHAAYVANFNIAQEQYAEAEAKGDLQKIIQLQPALKFNGGGERADLCFEEIWDTVEPAAPC